MTHAIVHLPATVVFDLNGERIVAQLLGEAPAERLSLYEWITGRKPHDEAATPTTPTTPTTPSRPSLSIDIALVPHQVRSEPHDGNTEAT